jgi:L-malate glycosyltransferase
VMFGAGHGPGQEAEKWASVKGLADGVEFRGNTEYSELLRYLRVAVDVLIHPSLEEAHPMTVCEAMAIGLPVIGGIASGGVPYTLAQGKAGVLVDVRSPAAIVKAMKYLAEHEHIRHNLSRASRDIAKEKFHLHTVASQYENQYHNVIDCAADLAQRATLLDS